jgi:hypothetical protein
MIVLTPTDAPSIPGIPLHPSQFVSDKYVVDPSRPPAIQPAPGFRVELGSDLPKSSISIELERPEEYGPTYRTSIFNEGDVHKQKMSRMKRLNGWQNT